MEERDGRLLLGSYVDVALAEGASIAHAADVLGVAQTTLGDWSRLLWSDEEVAKPLGPKAKRCDRKTRGLVLGKLRERGPGVGLPTLQASFPGVTRGELVHYQRRYRRAWVRGKATSVEELTWTVPGSVWTTDYTDPPCLVDGCFGKILSVRDLASNRHLLALPAKEGTARTTTDAMLALFSRHGPPLVLKSDNGSHFTAGEVGELLERHGVVPLLSPPGTPRYNGSVEAGIGVLKTRAHHEAARHGRPWEWTSDDVEAARRMANETGRPWGASGPTPDEAWSARRPLGDDLRRAFQETVGRVERELHAQAELEGRELDDEELASLRRESIRRALVAHGLLMVRRRRIRLRLPAHLRANHR